WRRLSSFAQSSASETASATYSSIESATVSCKPIFDRWLTEWRLANVACGQVMTGTPIHKASHVVGPPENGKGSRMRTRSRYALRYSAYDVAGRSSSRPSSTPCSENRLSKLCLTLGSPSPWYFSTRRDREDRSRIAAQHAITSGVILARLLKLPNVVKPFL